MQASRRDVYLAIAGLTLMAACVLIGAHYVGAEAGDPFEAGCFD